MSKCAQNFIDAILLLLLLLLLLLFGDTHYEPIIKSNFQVPSEYALYIAKNITIKNNNACEIIKPPLNDNSNKIKQKKFFLK